MELSYAQNLEDYHLARVFAGQPDGFYIDIGAGHPVADNVSFWFYLKGWRGIVVEPQKSLAELYDFVRPRDVAVCGLVGRSIGEADFHIVDRLHGFSTTVEAHARGAATFGAGYSTLRLPTTTLAALCEAQRPERIDFLKVDVEGAEADVLAGADWERWRPRVVVAEAVTPGSMAEAWREWETVLLAHRYSFAFFDGLNRFYVSEEAGLAGRFPDEPTPWATVRHLHEFGRPPEDAAHPDHALARTLISGFLATLPRLDRDLLLTFLTARSGSAPPTAGAMDTDLFRAALGRIACFYDGGQIMDDEREPPEDI